MATECSEFYTECERITAEKPVIVDPPELSISTQEIIRARCPDCLDALTIPIDAGIEHQRKKSLTSFVRALGDKTQKIIDSLKGVTLDDDQEFSSVEIVSKNRSTQSEEEMTGKENIDTRHSPAEKLKTATSGNSNGITTKQSGDGQETTEAIKEAEALAREVARTRMLGFVTRITSNFGIMQDKIDTANKRIADIYNYKLIDFMGQGIDEWTLGIHQAMMDCENDLIAECKELANSLLGSSAA